MGCVLAAHQGSFSTTSESSIVSGFSPLRIGARIHMNVVRHYVHMIQPHYDAAIAAVEGHVRF